MNQPTDDDDDESGMANDPGAYTRAPTMTERQLAVAAAMEREPQPAPPANGPVTLNAVEAAYVAMIEGEHRAATLQAQQLRAARFAVIMKAHGIVDGSSITIVPSEDGRPMQLVVVAPPASNGASA